MDNAGPPGIVRAMDHDALIAGGGLNGTALALALASGGLRVGLVDPLAASVRSGAGFDGRSYALSLGSVNLLRALGIWFELEGDAQPILAIRVSDGHAGQGASPLALAFDHAEIEEGPMGHMVEDRHLRPALLRAVERAGIALYDRRAAVAHAADPTGIRATLDDGTEVRARLLVGCDGKRSPTAVRAGIGRMTWGYGQTGMVAAISHGRPHEGTAHQFFMPEGPLAILPLTGNRSSIVWTERADRAEAVAALDDAAYLETLRPRFGDFLGDIALAGSRFSYPLGLSLAHRMAGDRVALVGDAAHAVHPIAGQGLNAGLKDVGALAEVLVEARRRGEDIGRADVLERYQRWRRWDVATLALATDGFNRLFSNDNPFLRLARDAGLAMINAWPEARRGFIREAAGLTGDRPRLLAGRPL
ncbi:2-octaprenyl-6-methoxyphenyl hydroxylase [Rhodobacteraceae bacterium CCMM004]|nr:2-octaprenyl-6-methoxyphenyl hydroxylase [Rhodobacteraceae bacterium CCMM004]